MARVDAVGLFWEDVQATGRNKTIRVMPSIPDTGWLPPTYLPDLSSAKAIAIDVETYDPELEDNGPGWARGKGHLVGVSIGVPGGGRWYYPLRHEVEPEYNWPVEPVLAWLRNTLGNPKQPKIGANLTYDIGWLRQEGVIVRGELFDVQFAEALLDERAQVALETLATKYLGEGKESSLLYRWCSDYYGGAISGKQRANIYRAPARLVGPYAESDADLPLRLAEVLYPLIWREGLYDLFRMECDLIYLTIDMRFEGVSVDVDAAEKLRDKLKAKEDQEQQKLDKLVGFHVEINASASLAKAFDEAGLPYPRTDKGNPSFTKGFLKEVNHPISTSINEIRKLAKLRGTFVESYVLDSHVNGKVYGQFHLLRGDEGGTRSGRFSSSTPNLQNLPSRDDELAPMVRGIFTPDYEHMCWRKYDYCVAPETRVLTPDLRWIPACSLEVGMPIVAFDEDKKYSGAQADKGRRYLRNSTVTALKKLTRPCYRITTNKGSITCSDKHRWLGRPSQNKNAPARWMFTETLKVGASILRAVEPWENLTENYDLGWLSGFFDGEGWISSGIVGVGQKEGLCYTEVKRLLHKYDFAYEEHLNKGGVWLLRLTGGRDAVWRFLGQVRPLRLLAKVPEKLIEGVNVQNWGPADEVLAIEYLGEQEVIAIETDHKTFIAEGLCSHNSQVEYRFLAHFAVGRMSQEVRDIFSRDPHTDYHVMTQELVTRQTGQELSRKAIKNINFGLIYGMGVDALSAGLGLKASEGKKLFAAYHEGAPFAKATMEEAIQEALTTGVIRTVLGRKSRFDLWEPDNWGRDTIPLPYDQAILKYGNIRRAQTHKALNRRLQGSAADLMKKAMWICWKDGIFAETGTPRLTVHDELDFSDPGGKDEAFREMKRVLETAIPLKIPIIADCDIGPDWGHVEELVE